MNWFIAYIILGTIITLLIAKFIKHGSYNCPREQQGYNCHRSTCDHSDDAWRRML